MQTYLAHLQRLRPVRKVRVLQPPSQIPTGDYESESGPVRTPHNATKKGNERKVSRNDSEENVIKVEFKKKKKQENGNHRRGGGWGRTKEVYQPAVGLAENREREPMVDVSWADKSFLLSVGLGAPKVRAVAESSEVRTSCFPSTIATEMPGSKKGQRILKTSARSP